MDSEYTRYWRAFRSRRDNPLARLSQPFTGGYGRLFRAVVLLGLPYALFLFIHFWMHKFVPYGSLQHFFLGAELLVLLLYPPVMLNELGHSQRREGELYDLELSLLTPEECAFGAVWRPFVYMLAILPAFIGSQLISEFSAKPTMAPPFVIVVRVLIIPLAATVAFLQAANYWLPGAGRMTLFLLHPLKCLLWFALIAGLQLAVSSSDYTLNSIGHFSLAITILALVALVLLKLRDFTDLAAGLFFQSIHPEGLRVKSWLRSEWSSLTGHVEADARARLARIRNSAGRARNLGPFVLLLLGLFCGLIYRVVFNLDFESSITRRNWILLHGTFGIASLLATLAATAGIAGLLQRRTRVELVRGHIVRSVLAILGPTFITFLTLVTIAYLFQQSVFGFTSGWHYLMMLGLVTLVLVESAFFLRVGLFVFGRQSGSGGRGIIALLLALAVLLCGILAGGFSDQGLRFFAFPMTGLSGDSIEAFLVVSFVVWLFADSLPHAIRRIHRRLGNNPQQALNSAPVPAPPSATEMAP